MKNINLANKLQKNAAIMSLVKMKNLSLEDIVDPNVHFDEVETKLDDLVNK